MKDNSFFILSKQSYSLLAMKCATPDLVACARAPPNSSKDTSWLSTSLTTSGPVTNIWPTFSTITTKSVIAGEYTAPPAHGPMLAVICGITPEAMVLWKKISPYPSRLDRKSTRLNSSHANISYAVFCLKKKKQRYHDIDQILLFLYILTLL